MLYASPFDPDAPDYERFPLAREAQALECTVEEGELLYLPAGWVHQVRALGESLSMNLWADDWPLGCPVP